MVIDLVHGYFYAFGNDFLKLPTHPMVYHVLTLILLPFLLLQGKWVRRVTPKLPEPEGERQGVTGTGVELNVLILGDSAAAGVGVNHQSQALLGQLVEQLSQHYQVHWQLCAQTGDKTRDTINKIQQQSIKPVDVVITSLGVNDVTSAISPNKWLSQQKKLMQLVSEKYQAKYIIISQVPPMGDFPALPQPLRAFLGYKAALFNQQLSHAFSDCSHIQVLSFDSDNKHTMAADGFHPSASIYREWAQKLCALIISSPADRG